MQESFRDQIRHAIRGARLEEGLSLRALAGRSGVSRSGLSAFETGVISLPPATVERIADALGVSIEVTVRRGGRPSATVQPSTLGHGTCVDALHGLFTRCGLATATEERVLLNGTDRDIDLLGFDARVGRLVVVEVKIELRDVGDLKRQVARYAQAALRYGHLR